MAMPFFPLESRSILTTCAWIETSRAETGSSHTRASAAKQGRGDDGPLPLAAGKLVREAPGLVGTKPDSRHQLGNAGGLGSFGTSP